MTGAELKAIREHLGLSSVEMGRALGYSGDNVSVTLRRYERDEREIPVWIARLAKLLKTYGCPEGWQWASMEGSDAL